MKVLKDEEVYKGSFLRVIKRYFENRDGREDVWEMVERLNQHGNIFLVAAVTPENELVLEKIFRVPLNEYVLELPAGLSDIRGEPDEDTARRELLEETGYEAEEMELVLSGPFDAGLHSHEISLFIGRDAKKIKEPSLDMSEEIEVVKVRVSELVKYLQNSQEKIDVKILAALPFFTQKP